MTRAVHHLQEIAAKRRAASSAMRRIILAITTQQPPLQETSIPKNIEHMKEIWQKFLKIFTLWFFLQSDGSCINLCADTSCIHTQV